MGSVRTKPAVISSYYAETRLHGYIISIHRGQADTLIARYTCRRSPGVGLVAVNVAMRACATGQAAHFALIKCIDTIEGADGRVLVLLPLQGRRTDLRH